MNLCVASTVDLSKKSLASIPTSISNDCTILDLSFNQLKIIPKDSLSELTGLLQIDLSHNPIDDIDEGFLQSNQQLNTIKCDSCFECSCFKSELHKWITRVTTTVITTSFTCEDGTSLQDIEHTLCSGVNSSNQYPHASNTVMIFMALEVVVAVNAAVVTILILVKNLKQRHERSDDVNGLVSTSNTINGICIEGDSAGNHIGIEMSKLGQKNEEISKIKNGTADDKCDVDKYQTNITVISARTTN
ncbi:unnamed protein product [Mytilus edulis]|uniref:Uncharacterized protein n=1 Tax=Mytilus edulis TaxID=6550 RepID=A0A8S3TQH1_MYTED|nr:unnamed protein product [Mytilus edulis]